MKQLPEQERESKETKWGVGPVVYSSMTLQLISDVCVASLTQQDHPWELDRRKEHV